MTWGGRGSTRRWRQTRARTLARDGYTCRIKGPRCTTVATEVHHIRGRGVSEQDRDLVAACSWCNGWLGDPTASTDPAPRPRTAW